MNIDIKGHSGCNIDVIDIKDKLYVRKSSNDIKYIDRLYEQGNKQINDYNNQKIVGVPHITKNFINKDLGEAYIIMDYIYAKNFIDYFEHASKNDIDDFINTFCEYIKYELNNCTIENISKDIFINKFKSVKGNCFHNELLIDNHITERLLDACETIFNQLPDYLQLPIGKCHGDLTFSNILFTNNKFYFIDYLDSFIETPIQDIVKLKQDTLYFWSIQMYNKKFDKIRLKIIFDYIDTKINDYFRNNEYYYKTYNVLQLMNILRILPYVKKESVRDFLYSVIDELLNKFNDNTHE